MPTSSRIACLLNMRYQFEYHWTPILICADVQFEFVRCFGSLCYSNDTCLLIVVSGRSQPHISISLVLSTLWDNQYS